MTSRAERSYPNGAQPVTDIMKRRYSCRSYRPDHLPEGTVRELESYLQENSGSPFDSAIRFVLVASSEGDTEALRGLGTYGFIKNPAAFFIGALKMSPYCYEDYGFLMEKNVLSATSLGLGTCWIGGSFTRSSFAERIGCAGDERVPAVVAVGIVAERTTVMDSMARFTARSRKRKPWSEIIFQGDFGAPLSPEEAGPYRGALEMLRIAPSASNKQPWRIVKGGTSDAYHFYLCRSKSYGLSLKVTGADDLQRIDMGIAMCHFELSAREAGLQGRWQTLDPAPSGPKGCEYLVSWVG